MPDGRLKWQCRRGTVELDLWLSRFLEHVYDHAPEALQAAFRQLLTLPDEQLLRYLWQQTQPQDPSLADLLRVMNISTHTSVCAASSPESERAL
ncbi:MAG: succinate dehydrogenase assembly factor 2 [Methylococcales bacterium]|nr:succinate dehydrogenase assembly factor 2 [Methylococcales bacterium]